MVPVEVVEFGEFPLDVPPPVPLVPVEVVEFEVFPFEVPPPVPVVPVEVVEFDESPFEVLPPAPALPVDEFPLLLDASLAMELNLLVFPAEMKLEFGSGFRRGGAWFAGAAAPMPDGRAVVDEWTPVFAIGELFAGGLGPDE